jgi:glycosyltransferase involved in cell wall biosynthesis
LVVFLAAKYITPTAPFAESSITLSETIRSLGQDYSFQKVPGCVVTESMTAGTPVIGSRCGGIPQLIVDGVTGFLFTPGDEHGLDSA